ncbi:MAG: hypothetical protein QOF55_1750, partial [Thermoleophilaceae bacterium]|nr:hypothetical protein [Thermoleophilaceae bacterium]
VGLSLLLAAAAAAPAGAATPRSSLKALLRQTSSLPTTVVPRAKRRKLANTVRHALKFVSKKPCTAVADLSRYRRVLGTVKVKSAKKFARGNRRVAALGPASLKVSQKLLAGRKTRGCGGGVAPSTLPTAQPTIMKSDENGMVVHMEMPALHFTAETGGGHAWTKLLLPNTDSPETPGTPGIPVVGSTFGVPDGATVKVTTNNATTYSMGGVDVFPAQPQSVDLGSNDPPPNFMQSPFAAKPFTLDATAYKTPGLMPANPADGGVLGTSRDILIGNLQVPAAQYNPVTKQLVVIKSIDLGVTFEGGNHTFHDVLGSPWEKAQQRLLGALLNAAFIKSKLNGTTFWRCGEEMLVITNPMTLSAADTFAAARRTAGIRTVVVQTGAAAGQIGTTADAIQTFIRSRLTAPVCIHPSYVTIIGDDKLVPTFAGLNGIPSDLGYSLRDNADELPDVAVGRILGNDLTEVNNAITKIVGYETTAPSSGDFLTHATIAAQFQDDNGDGREERTFVQFAETVRNGLTGRGVTVDRIYHDSPGTTPTQFNDGTPLPASLLKPTFPWTGTGAQVSAAWNAGRFLVVHRDHGWSDGWGTPGFGTADVNALTNGSLLPVVLSINCSSAAYDYDDTSFVQSALVKPNGGAVGAFGDTRDSPSWSNSQIALGFVDALLPSVLPAEGPATKQRMGDALINGKLRLAGLAPPPNGDTRNELYLWHYFGDPSMQMWGGGTAPRVFNADQFKALYREGYSGPPVPGDPPPYEVHATLPAELNGQPISLLRSGQVVGKAFAAEGAVTIPASFGDGSVRPGDLQIAVEGDDAQPIDVAVDGVPAPTTLTQTCPSAPPQGNFAGSPMTTTGKLDPGFAGASIVVTYTRPDQTTFTKTVTTDANGNWSSTITPNNEAANSSVDGDWKQQANYAGDASHRPSAGTACSTRLNSG